GGWTTVVFALLLAGFLAKKSEELSRLSTSAWFVLTPALLIGVRVTGRTALGVLRRHGKTCRPTAILGATKLGRTLIDEIERAPWLGLRVVGVFDDRSRERCDASCLGAIDRQG